MLVINCSVVTNCEVVQQKSSMGNLVLWCNTWSWNARCVV